ncbi:MAG: cation transporter [Acidimicrobiales bacterium]
MTVSRFRVEGMDCSAEEQLVRMRLDQLDNIEHVGVDLQRREVTVEHTSETAAVTAALASLDLGVRHLGDGGPSSRRTDPARERAGLGVAFGINAAFFVAELAFGLVSRSMGLIADGLDMGADASVYALSLAAVGTSTARKNRLARASGYLQLALAFVGLIEVVRRFVVDREPPDTTAMIVLSALALVGNIATIVVLQRIKSDDAHLQASWIFTANDIKVNALVIVAAIAVAIASSDVPDLAAGAIIFAIVANGARRIIGLTR